MSLSSLPPTEGADVSNDSLFSDSVEFDAAQKPRDEAAEQLANGHGSDAATATAAATSDDGATTPNGHGGAAAHRGGTVPSDAGRLDDAVVPAPPPITSHMKPRQLATRQPQQWRDVQLRAPDDDDDPDDEFDMASVQQPVYDTVADGGDATGKAPHAASSAASASGGKSRVAFLHGEPDARGDVTNCFDEPGLLYRIVDKKNRVWAFYNDSLTFEVHITCTFGKHSKLEALDHTQMTRTAADEYVAEVVVYPCETERFVKGFVNGFSSKLRAVPLSNEYYATRTRQQWDGTIRREIDAIRAAIAADVAHEQQQQQQQRATDTASVDATAAAATAVERDDEAILRVCLAHQLPFVDLTFPPTQASLDAGALRPLKRLPWVRPRMYVAPEMRDQLRLFRQPIVPGHVAEGELGDCWLMCAVATIAESPRALMQLFRHPRGADAGRHERALGAYRVTVNKNGLWRSVIVDDYLPVVANTPKFAHGTDPCELWPAILQKAYAKLHGSYAAIQAGDPIHALTDLTGCLSMRFDDEFALAAAEQHAASSTTAAAAAANASSSSSSASAGAKTPLSPSSLKLFERLLRWHEAGHHIIVTTPGKAPAVLVDGAQNKTLDCSDEPELMQRLEGTGLLPGHAYTVLSLRHFVKERVQLVCLRRAWDYGLPVTGDWSATSSLWAQYPAIAANIQRHAAADASLLWLSWQTLLRHCTGGGVCFTGRLGTCGDDGDGGAAGNRTSSAARRRRSNNNNNNSLSISHISNNNSIASLTRSLTTAPAAAAVYDYRVPLTFADGRPSVVFAVYVTQPTQLCLTLSNIDNRTLLGGSAKSSYVDADNDNEHGRRGSNKSGSGVVSNGGGGGGAADDGSHNGYGGGDDKTSMRSTSAAAAAMAAAAAVAADDASVIDYPPIMLSLCAPCEDEAATYDVVLNTAADVMRPSPSRWTFLQAREIGMMCELQPSTQPYLVLPRLMETADADANDVSASAIAAAAAVARASYKTLDRRYFANDYARSFPATTTMTTSAESEVPVTFGLRCAIALQPAAAASSSSTHEGAVSVRLCRLDGGNCVFENFPRFPSDDLGDVPTPLYYQVKPPQQGYADEKTGTALS